MGKARTKKRTIKAPARKLVQTLFPVPFYKEFCRSKIRHACTTDGEAVRAFVRTGLDAENQEDNPASTDRREAD